jgi:GNAT superfamily N-acetyltransferase
VQDDRSTVLVAVDDAGLAGFCTTYLDLRSVRFGLRAWVEDLAVAPDRRSQGTGAALLAAARAWARERGATHLELDSGDARTDAHRFYEREAPDSTSRCFGWRL